MNNILKRLDSVDEYKYLKKETNLFRKCHYLTLWLFDDNFDNNRTYIKSLLSLSSKMTTKDGAILCLLYAIIKNISDITYNDFIEIGIPHNILEILKLISNQNDYIEQNDINDDISIIVNSKELKKISYIKNGE